MTKIHLQAAARLQRELDSLEKSVGVLEQAGWMPIPKPLTDEEIIETCDTWVVDDIGNEEVIKIVRRTERAHGIGEKE